MKLNFCSSCITLSVIGLVHTRAECGALSDAQRSMPPLTCEDGNVKQSLEDTSMKTQISGDSYLQSSRSFVKASSPHKHPLPVHAESYPIPGLTTEMKSKEVRGSTLQDETLANASLSKVSTASSILNGVQQRLVRSFGRFYFRDESSMIVIIAMIVFITLVCCILAGVNRSESDVYRREAESLAQRPISRAILVPTARVQSTPQPSAPALRQSSAPSSRRDSFAAGSLPGGRLPRQINDGLLMPPPSSVSVLKTVSGRPSHLCAGLVVPQGSECVLAMPLLESVGIPLSSRNGSVDVKDLEGSTVVRCEASMPDWNRSDQQTVLELRTLDLPHVGSKGQLIGRCTAESTPDGRRQILIFDAGGDLYAHVMPDPYRPSYVLSGLSCTAMVFSGNFDEHVVNVTNDVHEPIADTEPCQTKFDPHKPHVKIRVLSGVDVGLVLSGLFAVIFLGSR